MGTFGVLTMRLKLRLRISRTTAAFCLGFAAALVALGVLALRASASPEGQMTAETVSQTPPPPPNAEPAPVDVPQTASAARASGSGGGGQNWMSGNASQLGAEFKRSVAHQFGNGTMGQAHMAMAGLGFQCAPGANGMSCEKSLQADNCLLTWSVNIKSRGANVSGAGGEGFARQCS